MFDLNRLGLPCEEVDANGRRWLCVYLVSVNAEHVFYLAVPLDAGDLPQPCSLIAVPREDKKAK